MVATSRAAAQLHLHVGSRLAVGIYGRRSRRTGSRRFYRKLDLTVTGIGVVSTQVVQDDIDADRTGFLIGTPALDREFVPCCASTSYIGLKVAAARYDAAVAGEYLHLTGDQPDVRRAAAHSCCSCWRSTTRRRSRRRRRAPSTPRRSRWACSGSSPRSPR